MGRFRKTSAGGVVAAAVALVMTISASPAHADDPAPGAVTGRVVTEAPGAVTVNLFTTGGASAGQVRTGTDGSYTFPAVPPGTYKIQYGFLGRFQWSHQKLGFSAADVVAVTSGQSTTVVEETMLLPGVVEVVATDAVSGAPVDAICAGTSEFGQQCGATGGVLRLTNLAAGPHTIQVRSSDGLHARAQVAGVYVVLGQATRVEVSSPRPPRSARPWWTGPVASRSPTSASWRCRWSSMKSMTRPASGAATTAPTSTGESRSASCLRPSTRCWRCRSSVSTACSGSDAGAASGGSTTR
ncbi:collagen binding domain-containing protein [Phytohabitans flavus]|uniref:MSCRAMM family protein n=1 Tax=Phytohabitans flavus TaxID=1076124 RepID=UPI00362D7F35